MLFYKIASFSITFQRKLMAKNKHRYEVEGGRRAELKEWLTEKLQILQTVSTTLNTLKLS